MDSNQLNQVLQYLVYDALFAAREYNDAYYFAIDVIQRLTWLIQEKQQKEEKVEDDKERQGKWQNRLNKLNEENSNLFQEYLYNHNIEECKKMIEATKKDGLETVEAELTESLKKLPTKSGDKSTLWSWINDLTEQKKKLGQIIDKWTTDLAEKWFKELSLQDRSTYGLSDKNWQNDEVQIVNFFKFETLKAQYIDGGTVRSKKVKNLEQIENINLPEAKAFVMHELAKQLFEYDNTIKDIESFVNNLKKRDTLDIASKYIMKKLISKYKETIMNYVEKIQLPRLAEKLVAKSDVEIVDNHQLTEALERLERSDILTTFNLEEVMAAVQQIKALQV
jgi:hypothetical protein